MHLPFFSVLRFTVAGAALFTAASAAPPTKTALPGPTVPEGWGINIHFTDPQPGEMQRFGEAGFGFARMDFSWEGTEKAKDVYDFAAYDRLYATLAKVGTKPIFILDYGNDLYQKGSPSTPEARGAFARFAAAAAQHFADRSVVWEIWNEPNIGFWKPTPNADDYAALAIETAHAIHAAVPGATVIAPGSSGFPWEFLETAFKAGLLREIDGVSVHPYRGSAPESAADDFAHLRVLIARYAPKGKEDLPILSSEWGYSTQTGGTPENVQAAFLARMWLANVASGVNLSIFYDWRNDGDDPKENEHRFGTVQRDFTPKPSFLAAKALIESLRGYSFRHRLVGSDANEWKLLFQKGDSGEIALVTWSTETKGMPAFQAPVVHPVTPDERDYVPLLHLASVRLKQPGGTLVAGPGTGKAGTLVLEMVTAEAGKNTLSYCLIGSGPQYLDYLNNFPSGAMTVNGLHAMSQAAVGFPAGLARAKTYSVNLVLQWNGQTLPAIMPLSLRGSAPLLLSVAPAGAKARVTIDNPGGALFSGDAVLTNKQGQTAATRPVEISQGTLSTEIDLPVTQGETFGVALIDDSGKTVTQLGPIRFAPLKPFPDEPTPHSGYRQISLVENAARPSVPVEVVRTPEGSPTSFALRFPYTFESGWRYDEYPSTTTMPIPAGAKALTLWVYAADPTGDYLRCRFKDATGQTFQPDLGRLTWKGWKLVTIPFDGVGGGNWGGSGSGTPSGTLSWETLLLVDSADKTKAHGGELLVTAPIYLFGN